MGRFWTFIIIVLTACSDKGQGLEIYRVSMSYPDHTRQPRPDCYYCFELTRADLFESPVLTEDDIRQFDWDTQTITLTESGLSKMKELEIPLQGMPIAITVDGEPIYGLWFWNVFSSYGCDRVFTTFMGENLRLEFGHMKPYGEDPRFNSTLETYVKEKLNN